MSVGSAVRGSQSQSESYEVERRFTEFKDLREAIAKTELAATLEPMPEKRLFKMAQVSSSIPFFESSNGSPLSCDRIASFVPPRAGMGNGAIARGAPRSLCAC